MAVPDYQSMMRPILEFLSDGKEHNVRDMYEHVAKYFNLSLDDKSETIPSGPEPRYINRSSWAKTYMSKAGLVVSPARGMVQITERGQDVLQSRKMVNNKLLRTFNEFQNFKKIRQKDSRTISEDGEDTPLNPDEQIEQSLKIINNKLQDDLLQELYQTDPFYFEHIVADLMKAMGYGYTHVTKRSNDGGVDAIVNEDALGLDRIFIQAKRYTTNKVNAKEIRDFVGALEMKGVSKGIFITTSDFAEQARSSIQRVPKSIILINGVRLSELMVEYGVGVSVETEIKLHKLDKDYFSPEV